MKPTNNLTRDDVYLLLQAVTAYMSKPLTTDWHDAKEHKRLREIYYMLLLGSSATIIMDGNAASAGQRMFEEWDYSEYPTINRVLNVRPK